jgi:hypothetical protein
MSQQYSFEQYCNDEAVRQTLRGHRVPHANRNPVAYSQWMTQARRTYEVKTRGAVSSSTPSRPLPLSEIAWELCPLPTLGQMMSSIANLATPSALVAPPQQQKKYEQLHRFEPVGEIEALLQCHEVLLRMFFHSMLSVLELSKEERLHQNLTAASPSGRGVNARSPNEQVDEFKLRRQALQRTIKFTQESLKKTQSRVQELDHSGTLGPQPGRYCHVHVLTELFSFYRLLRNNLSSIPQEKRRMFMETSQLVSQRYRGDAFLNLFNALSAAASDTQLSQPTASILDTEQLRALGVLAAVTVPYQFPSITGPALRGAFPDAQEPSATLVPIAGAVTVSADDAAGEQQSSDDDCTDDDGDDIESVDGTKAPPSVPPPPPPAVRPSPLNQKRTAVLLHSGTMDAPTKTTAQQNASGNIKAKRPREDVVVSDDEVDVALGDIVRQKPVSALRAPDLGNGGSSLPRRPTVALPAARATVAAAPVNVVVRVAAATAAIPYPCRSKYHADFVSDPKKHASKECQFCSVCHMMELLFNGCKMLCCWKHEPTPRKIQQHLKGFPHVYRLADQRMHDWSRGVFPDPIELPRR